MRISTFLLAGMFLPTPLLAQSQPGVPSPETAQAQGQTGSTIAPTAADVSDIKVNQIVIFEGDVCPPGQGDEIVICAVLPNNQRFRIPENLRTDPNAPENQAWTNQAIALSYVGATGIGSCSTVGPGGFTGCNQQLINQAVAERRGRPEVNWARLIEQARQERLAGINASASQAEAEAGGNRRLRELRIQPGQLCPPSTEAVIITCTYPDGRTAPAQPSGEPELPVVGGRMQPSSSRAPQPQSQPPRQ